VLFAPRRVCFAENSVFFRAISSFLLACRDEALMLNSEAAFTLEQFWESTVYEPRRQQRDNREGILTPAATVQTSDNLSFTLTDELHLSSVF
jgi:hypothetical protein